MIYLGILFIILQVFDILTTNYALKNGCQEGNPLIRKSLDGNGRFPLDLIIIKVSLGISVTGLLIFVNQMAPINILNLFVLGLDIFILIIVINNIKIVPKQRRIDRTYYIDTANLKQFMQVELIREWVAAMNLNLLL